MALNQVRSLDGATVTIYSEKVAIGGLTSAKNGSWYWALFGINDTGLDDTSEHVEYGGVEQDVDSAFAALSGQWLEWLRAAGLTQKDPEFIN